MDKNKLFGLTSNKEIRITFIFKYFYPFLTILGACLMAIGGDFAYEHSQAVLECEGKENCYFPYIFNNWVCLILGAIIGIIGLIGANNDSKELKKANDELKKDNKKLKKIETELNDYKEENERLFGELREKNAEVVKNWLKIISNEMGLNTYERLTIYYEHNEEFTLLSRFSQNTVFNKIHSQKFPLNQGVISNSWQHNSYKEESSPKFEGNGQAYYDYMSSEYGYKRERLESITMKSDRFYGIAIQEAEDNIGVILYEKITNEDTDDFNRKCDKLLAKSKRHSSYLTKYIRHAIKLDRTFKVKTNDTSAEDDLLNTFKGDK